MKNTYLTLVAVLALATAAALTPMAVQQQVFAQDGRAESETETGNEAKNKCNNSGLSTCDQTASSRFCVTSGGIVTSPPLSPSILPVSNGPLCPSPPPPPPPPEP